MVRGRLNALTRLRKGRNKIYFSKMEEDRKVYTEKYIPYPLKDEVISKIRREQKPLRGLNNEDKETLKTALIKRKDNFRSGASGYGSLRNKVTKDTRYSNQYKYPTNKKGDLFDSMKDYIKSTRPISPKKRVTTKKTTPKSTYTRTTSPVIDPQIPDSKRTNVHWVGGLTEKSKKYGKKPGEVGRKNFPGEDSFILKTGVKRPSAGKARDKIMARNTRTRRMKRDG